MQGIGGCIQDVLGTCEEEERDPLVAAELVPVDVEPDPLLVDEGVEEVEFVALAVLAAHTAAAKRCTSTVPFGRL